MNAADLRAWRARRKWTQEQAAEALGYSRRGYQDAEGRDTKGGTGEIELKMELAIAGHEATRPRSAVASVENLTLGDLTDEEIIKDCAFELERATTDGARSDWARKWGRAAIRALRAEDIRDELAGATRSADEAEVEAEKLAGLARGVIDELNALDTALFDKLPERFTDACDLLENAL